MDGDGVFEVLFQASGFPLYCGGLDGTSKRGWPIQDISLSGTAGFSAMRLGDLDGDGDLEIIAPVKHLAKLIAFGGDGEVLEGWPIELKIDEPHDDAVLRALAVGDVDFDGTSEIVVSYLLYVGSSPRPGPVFLING